MCGVDRLRFVKRTLLLCSAFLYIVSVVHVSAQNARMAADEIYYNGNILTGVGLDTAHPQRVSAVAVLTGLVMVAGTNDEAKKWQAERAKYPKGKTETQKK